MGGQQTTAHDEYYNFIPQVTAEVTAEAARFITPILQEGSRCCTRFRGLIFFLSFDANANAKAP